MPEEERLKLKSTVEDDFSEDLERLEEQLESVDRQIRETGDGLEKIKIDTDAKIGGAVADLGALQTEIEAIDDDVTIDVDVNEDRLLDEGVAVNRRGRGSQFIDEDTGQFIETEDAVDRRFDDIFAELDREIEVDVKTKEAMSKLGVLQTELAAIDDRITIDVDVDESGLLADDVAVNERGRGSRFIDKKTGQFVSPDDALDRRFGEIGDHLGDEMVIDVDVDESGLLADDVAVNEGGRGSRFIDKKTGQFVSPEDALDRRFGEIGDVLEDEMAVSEANITAGHADINAGATTGGGEMVDTGLDMGSGGDVDVGTAMASGGWPEMDPDIGRGGNILNRQSSSLRLFKDLNEQLGDTGDALHDLEFDDIELATTANPPTEFEAPFMQGRGAASGRQAHHLMSLFTGEDALPDFFEKEGRDYSVPSRNLGLAAEGLSSGASIDLVKAQQEAIDLMGDDDRPLRRKLGDVFEDLGDYRFTMHKFHQIIADIIPLLAIYVGALPAVIVALGGVAAAAIGAAAALAGIGVLGTAGMSLEEEGELSLEPIKERLTEVANTFIEAFGPLAQSLAPVVRTALQDIEAMAAPLAEASTQLLRLRDEFGGFMGFMGDALPSFIDDFLRFTDAMAPLLSTIVGAITGVDWFGYFAEQIKLMLPHLVALAKGFVNLLPFIVDLSRGFLIVAGVLTSTLGAIASVIGAIGPLSEMIGFLIGGLMLLITFVNLAAIQLFKTAAIMAGKAVAAAAKYTWSMITSAYATYGLAGALATVIGIATLGIGTIAILSSQFSVLGGNIADARDNLGAFANEKNAMNTDEFGGQQYGSTSGGGNLYQDNSKTVIYAGDQDSAARQQYSSDYESRQHRDAVFGGG